MDELINEVDKFVILAFMLDRDVFEKFVMDAFVFLKKSAEKLETDRFDMLAFNDTLMLLTKIDVEMMREKLVDAEWIQQVFTNKEFTVVMSPRVIDIYSPDTYVLYKFDMFPRQVFTKEAFVI